jgi:predicted nuclease of restriction endonuclease-like (RecB) superfamily
MKQNRRSYTELLKHIKSRIRTAQIKAVLSANAELIYMYWDIGKMIEERQQQEGWGTAVIPRLSKDIRNELPKVKGFSERNIGRMIAFYREYSELGEILPQAVAKLGNENKDKNLPQAVAKIETEELSKKICIFILYLPWGHNLLLIEKIKDLEIRLWYMQKTIDNGWSRPVLQTMIKTNAYEREGKAITNFKSHLPNPQSDLANQTLKDPYIFDFLTIEEPFHERELEVSLIRHLEKFLLELGHGFAFVGRQYHIEVGNNDFYIDLLFYHLELRCFIVIDLKKGKFKPDYAGKMNFYCNIIDEKLKKEEDQQTIGLILCQDKDKVLAEYSLRGINKPIGVSEYELTRALPDKLKSVLPSIEEIEKELES